MPFFIGLAWLLFSVAPLMAEDVAPQPIAVTNAKAIAAQLGKKAIIRGKVSRTGTSKGGVHFLNFDNPKFVVVCFPDSAATFKDAPPSEAFADKLIEISGTIEKYKEQFQIKLEDPSQIKVIEEGSEQTGTSPNKTEDSRKPSAQKPQQSAPIDPKRFFDSGSH